MTVSRLTWDFKFTNISLDSHFLAWDDSAAVWGSWGVEGGDKLVRHRRNQPSKSASPERETDKGESCRPTALVHSLSGFVSKDKVVTTFI